MALQQLPFACNLDAADSAEGEPFTTSASVSKPRMLQLDSTPRKEAATAPLDRTCRNVFAMAQLQSASGLRKQHLD
jgi:hypothetical protein